MENSVDRREDAAPHERQDDPWGDSAQANGHEHPLKRQSKEEYWELQKDGPRKKMVQAFHNGYWKDALNIAAEKKVSEDELRRIAEWGVKAALMEGGRSTQGHSEGSFEELMDRFGFRKEEYAMAAKLGALDNLSRGGAESAEKIAKRFGVDEEFMRDPRTLEVARKGILNAGSVENLLAADEFLAARDPDWTRNRPDGLRKIVTRFAIDDVISRGGGKMRWLSDHFGVPFQEIKSQALSEAVGLRAANRAEALGALSEVFGFTDKEHAEIDRQSVVETLAGATPGEYDKAKDLASSLGLKKAEIGGLADQALRKIVAAGRIDEAAGALVKEFKLGKDALHQAVFERQAALFQADRLDEAEKEAKEYGLKEGDVAALIKTEVMRRFASGDIEKGVRFAERTKLGQDVLKSKDVQEAISHGIMKRK